MKRITVASFNSKANLLDDIVRCICMITMFKFILAPASSMDCLSLKDEMGSHWAKGKIRSQAGGFNFYLGKGVSESKVISILLAEGLALSRLTDECQKIPLKTKFNERCIEKKGGNFNTYARASITEKDCSGAKKVNLKLHQTLKKYNQHITSKKGEKCSKNSLGTCMFKGEVSLSLGNYTEAEKYFTIACIAGEAKACNILATEFKNFKIEKKKRFIYRSCNLKDQFGCVMISSFHKGSVRNKFLLKSCRLGGVVACYGLLENYNQHQKYKQTISEGTVLCNKGNLIACYYVGEAFHSLGRKKSAKTFFRKGCFQSSIKGETVSNMSSRVQYKYELKWINVFDSIEKETCKIIADFYRWVGKNISEANFFEAQYKCIKNPKDCKGQYTGK